MNQPSDKKVDAQKTGKGFDPDVDLSSAAATLTSDQKKELWNFIGERREMLQEDMCLHPGANCSGVICNAHSIQESKLSEIARAGQVYCFEFDPGKAVKNPLAETFTRLHIGKVSVFRGFCSTHDANLFRPIETEDFKCTPEQLFLFFYRAICRELHVRHCIAKAHVTAEEIARMHPTIPRDNYEAAVGWLQTRSCEEAFRLHFFKSKVDATLLNAEFRRLKHYVITFKRQPSVLSAAAFSPTSDFEGRRLRLVRHPLLPYPIMTITTLPTLSGGVAILSWFDNGPAEFEQFCSSLETLPVDKLTSSLIRLLFEFCDNIAIAPVWWDALSSDSKNALLNHARSGTSSDRMNESCLTEDGLCYDDWEVEMRFRL